MKFYSKDKTLSVIDRIAKRRIALFEDGKFETDIGIAYEEKTMKGLMDIQAGINRIPFEMRLIFQSNEAAPGIGTGRINGDTNIEAIGRMV